MPRTYWSWQSDVIGGKFDPDETGQIHKSLVLMNAFRDSSSGEIHWSEEDWTELKSRFMEEFSFETRPDFVCEMLDIVKHCVGVGLYQVRHRTPLS